MADTGEIIIRAGESRYPVITDRFRMRLGKITGRERKVVIVSNPTVYALYGQSFVSRFLPSGCEAVPIIIGDGERHKSHRTVNDLYGHFLDMGLGRKDTVIALGGGVVGDTAGFAAATFMRGVGLVQAPTTLLAMVDSSVGGKVGINVRAGKNLVGSFYQPQAVVLYPDWLATLGQREMVEGLAEIIKAGFLSLKATVAHTARLEPLYDADRGDVWRQLIIRAIRFKAGVIAGDVYDRGRRVILNFGHTFGHAIEKAEGYGRYRHGEAVLAGMAGALFLSHGLKRLSRVRMREYLEYLGPLTARLRPLKRASDDYVKPMSVDKKNDGGRPVFVLLEQIGRPVVRTVESRRAIVDAVDQMKEFVNGGGEL